MDLIEWVIRLFLPAPTEDKMDTKALIEKAKSVAQMIKTDVGLIDKTEALAWLEKAWPWLQKPMDILIKTAALVPDIDLGLSVLEIALVLAMHPASPDSEVMENRPNDPLGHMGSE